MQPVLLRPLSGSALRTLAGRTRPKGEVPSQKELPFTPDELVWHEA